MSLPRNAFKFLLIILLYSSIAYSQVTKFQLQLDFGKSVYSVGNVLNTSDGGYLICGTLKDSVGDYPFMVKVANYGYVEWKVIYQANTLPSTGNFVIQTSDGGFMLVGELVIDSINNDILVIRTDSLGNQLWTKTYGNSHLELGNNIVELPSGNFLIFGESTLAGIKKGIVIRINPSGDVLETNFLSIDVGFGLSTVKGKLFGTNQIIITGTGVTELITDTSGIYQGQANIQLEDQALTVDVIVSPTGKHISIGKKGWLASPASNNHPLYLTKSDSAGAINPLWIFTLNSALGYTFSTSLILAPNGNYVVAGNNHNPFAFSPLFLTEIDTNGNCVWYMSYSPANAPDFRPGGAVAATEGGYLLAGAGYASVSKYDLFIIKTDSIGNSGCNEVSFSCLTQITGNYVVPPLLSGSIDSIQNAGTPISITSSSYGARMELCYTSDEDKDLFNTTSLKYLPNPFKNYLSCEIPENIKGPFNLTIYDMLGAIKVNLQSHNAQWSGSELEMLPPGMYIANLQIPGFKEMYTKLFHY